MFKNFRNEREGKSEQRLDDAIDALKSALGRNALSASSRATIFAEARRPVGVLESLGLLLPRTGAFAIAASFPVVLVMTLALLFSVPSSIAPERHPASIRAFKDGGDVVFTVANGGTEHRVFKSTDPARFGAKEVKAVGGRFSDRADNGIELVFYRVD